MHDSIQKNISRNLNSIRDKIQQAACKAGRRPNDIRLVAVSKFHPVESIYAAFNDKHLIFGENRIQEAKKKFAPILSEQPDIKLHIIGPIQSNKLLDAVKIADTIETVDRLSILDPLEKAIQKTGRSPTLFIQINTGREPQKAGIFPEDADHFISLCKKRFGSSIQGVMGIPPVHEDPVPHFRKLANFSRKFGLNEISMGMSNDFETAIACGATYVRVGTGIFGTRPLNPKNNSFQ